MFKVFLQELLSPKFCVIEEINFKNEGSISQKALDSLPLAPDPIKLTSSRKDNIDYFCIDYLYGLIEADEKSDYLNPIYELKYSGLKSLGFELGKLLANKFKLEMIEQPEVVIPIPIHKTKKRERGINQSEFIADSFSKELGIKTDYSFLKRNFYTKTQTRLDKIERSKNVLDAFSIVSEKEYQNILLINDVYTTGSTINSAAKIIKKNFKSKVSAATVVVA